MTPERSGSSSFFKKLIWIFEYSLKGELREVGLGPWCWPHVLCQAPLPLSRLSFACDALPSTLLASGDILSSQCCSNITFLVKTVPILLMTLSSTGGFFCLWDSHFRMLPESICNVLLKHESPWRASHYWRQQHRMVMPRDTSSRLSSLVDKSEISILWIAGRVAEIDDPGEMLSRCPQVVLSSYC